MIVGCSKDSLVKEDAQKEQSGKIISEFDYSDTHFTISSGAPFETKANNTEEYLTVSADQGFNSFVLVSSKTIDSNNMVVFKHYDLQGELIATFYVIDGTLVDIDITLDESKDYVFNPLTKGREKGEACYASEAAYSVLSCIGKEK